MLLITTFVKLRVVPGRTRKRAGRPHAVPGRLILIHICHAMSMPRCAVALRSLFQNGMVVAWHECGMALVNKTRPHYVYQMGKTQSKPLAARHGRGGACQRRGMCELAFMCLSSFLPRAAKVARWIPLLIRAFLITFKQIPECIFISLKYSTIYHELTSIKLDQQY
jgi:hypothetical protein